MPNIKSAKKRVRVIETKTLRNKAIKSNLKTVIKKADAAVAANAADKEAAVKAAVKKIDQAAAKGLLHKNNAARKKSALGQQAEQSVNKGKGSASQPLKHCFFILRISFFGTWSLIVNFLLTLKSFPKSNQFCLTTACPLW